MTETHIKLRHYAFLEGVSAVRNGYTGPTPTYGNPEDVDQWRKGYLDEIANRLEAWESALPVPSIPSKTFEFQGLSMDEFASLWITRIDKTEVRFNDVVKGFITEPGEMLTDALMRAAKAVEPTTVSIYHKV